MNRDLIAYMYLHYCNNKHILNVINAIYRVIQHLKYGAFYNWCGILIVSGQGKPFNKCIFLMILSYWALH